MRRNPINFLYNPNHMTLWYVEVGPVANARKGSTQEHIRAKVVIDVGPKECWDAAVFPKWVQCPWHTGFQCCWAYVASVLSIAVKSPSNIYFTVCQAGPHHSRGSLASRDQVCTCGCLDGIAWQDKHGVAVSLATLCWSCSSQEERIE